LISLSKRFGDGLSRKFISTLFNFILSHKIQKFLTRNFGEALYLSLIDKFAIFVARLNANSDRTNLNYNGNPANLNDNLEIVYLQRTNKMKNLYPQIYNLSNLLCAWRKARKGKTKKQYVIEFEKDIIINLLQLQAELIDQIYKPKPLKTFILRDPKTRIISKSDFRDRVIHHAIVRIIEPIFDKSFIYDSCANRKKKGTLFAIKRFDIFKRKVTNSLKCEAFCLKCDIRHYFKEVDHKILLSILKRKIKDKKTIWLIIQILKNQVNSRKRTGKHVYRKGMPLGNLTSQFFANVYLDELDFFIKHKLKAKYYIRYVDDFIILHKSKQQLKIWQSQIINFLKHALNLKLHPDKSKIISLSKGIDFVGFRNFYYFKLLRRRNIRKMKSKIDDYKKGLFFEESLKEIFQGWKAYTKWANSYKLSQKIQFKLFASLLFC